MTGPVRSSGLLVPLFSAPSSNSWGIGDIGDIAPLAAWLEGAGQRILQLLPLNEMAAGHQSPYSAMSAMAIDPIYIRVSAVEEFVANGGDASLDADDQARLERARAAARVEYATLRPVKHHALCAAFERFLDHEWRQDTARAAECRAYIADEAWWLDDYALFRAIHEQQHGRTWTEWPDGLRHRDPAALDAARRDLARDMLFYQYLQWIAGTQWKAARAAAQAHGVSLFGDLPFMVDLHSADVWAHQDHFRLDRSVGVPPDAFSATGQDWGMPAYNWEAMASNGFAWLRSRARRSAALYDGYRVDHLVGFFRTYSRPRDGDGEPAFSPARQVDQLRLGEQVLRIFREPGSQIIAEDLGTVPDFVRATLTILRVPGFRVVRWERDWEGDEKAFRDPAAYPTVSVATTGTHDTEPMVTWWDAANEEERAALVAVPSIQAVADTTDLLNEPFVPVVRDVFLEALFASASAILLLPVQDVFGWSDRINEPATVSNDNWTYRLPWPVDQLDAHADARERQATLRAWAEKYSRI
jgi:4-alpha-glucanotransferase